MSKTDNKITVLQLIRDKKEILFGAFTDKLSKDKKIEEWKNILTTCQSLGLVPPGKDYAYVRDTFYSNLKRSTLSKRDNAKRTGTGGGRKNILTPIDDLILEIIGKTSPITDGIRVEPTSSSQENCCFEQNVVPDLSQTPKTSKNDSTNLNLKEQKTKIVRKGSKAHSEVVEEESKKKRKLDLQLEYLELNNYKLKLEILEMEQKLGVEPSIMTKEIKPNPENKIQHQDDSNQILLISNDNIFFNDDGTQTVLV